MISASSVISAILFYNAALLIICIICTAAPSLLKHGGTFFLLLAFILATVRLFTPLELPINHLIRSWNLLGGSLRLIHTYPRIMVVLIVSWITGAVRLLENDARLLYQANKAARDYQRDDSRYAEEIAGQLSIKAPIVVSRDVGMPYVGGLIRHTIYLPVLEFPKEEMGFVLRHEAQHIRNRDSTYKLFFRCILLIFWWDLVLYWFWHKLDNLLELYCDRRLTVKMTDRERFAYAEMLEGMKEAFSGRELLSPLAVDGLLKGNRDRFFKRRLEIIRNGSGKPTLPASIAALCLILVLFFASYLVVFQPAVSPLETEFHDGIEATYDENYDDHTIGEGAYDVLVLKGADGRYQLFVNYIFSGYLTEEEVNSEPYCNYRIFEESE